MVSPLKTSSAQPAKNSCALIPQRPLPETATMQRCPFSSRELSITTPSYRHSSSGNNTFSLPSGSAFNTTAIAVATTANGSIGTIDNGGLPENARKRRHIPISGNCIHYNNETANPYNYPQSYSQQKRCSANRLYS